VQLAQVAIRAVVDLVVELREPDLPLEADLRAARMNTTREVANALLADVIGLRPWKPEERKACISGARFECR